MQQSNFIVGIMKIRVIIVFLYIIFYSIILVFGTIQECNFWSKFSKCDRSFRGPIIYFIKIDLHQDISIYRDLAFYKCLNGIFSDNAYTGLWLVHASMVHFLQGNNLLRHLDKYITSI